jgi:peptide-methionine (R)-S-oxide reductase
MRIGSIAFASMLIFGPGCNRSNAEPAPAHAHEYEVTHTDAEWKKLLTPDQYNVLRKKGTERAFSGAYYNSHEKAIYRCAACGKELFSSKQKFDSGTGWPSFWAPIKPDAVETETDASLGMARTEVRCPRCGGHLGHVFDDGPKPTGLRYCINSVALKQEVLP